MRLRPADLHTSDRPSATAQWTTLGRALELRRPPAQRIVTDPYAPAFLSPSGRAVLRAAEAGAPLVHALERRSLAGLSAYALCRHRFIDEQLLAADFAQVLILGAGYDSRVWRFATVLDGRPVFEVDLPALSQHKAAVVAAHPDVFGTVVPQRVEIDFRTQSLAERLGDSRFALGARTFVAWEGVAMYLTRAAVVATLGVLAAVCGPGSVLAMDLWSPPSGQRPGDRIRRLGARAISLIGEPVAFGLPAGDAARFLAGAGFGVVDLAESVELASRFSTDGRPCERSLYVVAASS